MKKRSQATVSLIFPAIGAGLVFVGLSNYASVSADNPYAEKSSLLLAIFVLVGMAMLILGALVAYQMIKSKKRS